MQIVRSRINHTLHWFDEHIQFDREIVFIHFIPFKWKWQMSFMENVCFLYEERERERENVNMWLMSQSIHDNYDHLLCHIFWWGASLLTNYLICMCIAIHWIIANFEMISKTFEFLVKINTNFICIFIQIVEIHRFLEGFERT